MSDSTSTASAERVFLRVIGDGYTGQRNFKLPLTTPFRYLLRLMKAHGTLWYAGVGIDPVQTPQDLGMRPGVANAVRIEFVPRDAGDSDAEAAAAPQADAAEPGADRPAGATEAQQPPPTARPAWAAAPGSTGSRARSEGSAPAPPSDAENTAAASPLSPRDSDSQAAAPAAAAPPKLAGKSLPTSRPAPRGDSLASTSSGARRPSPPPSGAHRHDDVAGGAAAHPQPAGRNEPPVHAPPADATPPQQQAQRPLPTRHPTESELRAASATGPPRQPHHTPVRSAEPAAAAATPMRSPVRDTIGDGPYQGLPQSTLGGPGRMSALRHTAPREHRAPQTLEPAAHARQPRTALDRHTREHARDHSPPTRRYSVSPTRRRPEVAPQREAPTPQRETPLPPQQPQPQPQPHQQASPVQGAPAGYTQAVPMYAPMYGGAHQHPHPYAVNHSSFVDPSAVLCPEPSRHARPHTPPGVPQAHFDALVGEVRALRAEADVLRDELQGERTNREMLEAQLRQVVSLFKAQVHEQQAAAADDLAAREHRRLMTELREQRRSASQRSNTA